MHQIEVAELRKKLKSIEAYTSNPYWTSDLRWKIQKLAMESLRILNKTDELRGPQRNPGSASTA